MPAIPKLDAKGLRPARQTLGAILARDIIKERLALGWSQRELALQAGIRPETLCRVESGTVTPTVATNERIDAALKRGAGANAGA
jgi:predicted transcriptional regulator